MSPSLFSIFLEKIISDTLEDHTGVISIIGRVIINLYFANDINGLAGSREELTTGEEII